MSDYRQSVTELDGAAQLLAAARARASAAAADLAIPGELRLTDRQRTTVANLLVRLLRSIEDELRSRLAAQFAEGPLHAALSSARVEIAVPLLLASTILSEPPLLDALLRRAEEQRLHRAGGAENALLIELAGDPDPAIASEAMALLIAQSSRFDSFGEPLLNRSDLPAELEHHLVWSTAAALRGYMIHRHGLEAAAADVALNEAAISLLAVHDEGGTFEARCLRLARALRDGARLDDALLVRALEEGSVALFVAFLSVRTGLGAEPVWEVLSARSGRGAVLLLRAASVGREAAGAALMTLIRDEAVFETLLDHYDGTTEEGARRLLSLWRADAGYRAAVARLTG